jgi:hypothetical protein
MKPAGSLFLSNEEIQLIQRRYKRFCQHETCRHKALYQLNVSLCETVQHQSAFHIIHLAVCLTTGPKPLPKRTPHKVRARASSFKSEYLLLSLRSSSSFLRLLRRFIFTTFPPFIFPSVTCYRRQFIRKM